MIRYYKLFDLLNRRNIKRTKLLKIMSSGTLAKLGKGEIIKTDIIDKICDFLKCQPEDIMEHIEDIAINHEDKNDSSYLTIQHKINKYDKTEEIISYHKDTTEKESLISEIEKNIVNHKIIN